MRTKVRYKQKSKKQLFVKESVNSAIAYQQNKKKIFYEHERINIIIV